MHAVRRYVPQVEHFAELITPPHADERQQRPSLWSNIGESTHEYQLMLQEAEVGADGRDGLPSTYLRLPELLSDPGEDLLDVCAGRQSPVGAPQL